MLIFFVNMLFIGVWEFYYNQLKEENKKKFLLPLALAGLVVALIAIILYLTGLTTGLDGPSNAGFGVLPVAFAASVNIATLIVAFTPIIVSAVALIKGLFIRNK